VPSLSQFRFRWPTRLTLWLGIAVTGIAAPLQLDAVTLDEMLANPKLNAKKFANYFGDFAFEFSVDVQSPATFLSRERGDCDDYAVLADFVLKKHGLDTRLVHVRLAGRVAHAVCYVTENRAYLDYNNRKFFLTLARSGADLRDIATRVAASLSANWTTASEFTYSYATHRKIMISTLAQTGGEVPVPGRPSPFHVE
jgi:hypothetical protein